MRWCSGEEGADTHNRLIRGAVLAATAAVAAWLALPLHVAAHALPQSSVPAEGSSVQTPPASVLIVFGEQPDVGLSSITVVNSAGTDVDAGPTTAAPGKPAGLEVALRPHLPDGVYTVTWKTVSAVDGHLATGSFAFGIGVPANTLPHTAAVVGASAPGVIAVVSRLVLFAGLVAVLGGVTLGIAAFGEPPPALRKGIAVAAVLAFAGTAGVTATQIQAAGVSPAALLGSSLGRSLLARAIPALLLMASSLWMLFNKRRVLFAAAAAVAALVAMTVDVLNSHAAAEQPAALNELAQTLHIVAVGIWIGGLAALLVSSRGQPDATQISAARRLSTFAGIGLVTVAATGVFRAVIEVQTWQSLVSTAFGALVLLKIGLFLILAALGALNRYGNLPRLPGMLRRLRRVVTGEVLVAVGALTVTAALVNVAPPAEYAAAAAATQTSANLVVSGSDYATTVRVRMTVTPGTAGFNTFNVRVSDYDTGAAVSAGNVVLQFTEPFRPAIATSTLALRKQADGSFQARGGNLSLPGIWQIAVLVENGLQSTEVHLQLATITTPPVIQVSHFAAGLPTVYTIQINAGVQAQVYLDPNKPGADEFHVTFVAPSGNEVPMSDITIGMTPPSGTPAILPSRRLDDVGHFVADAHVPGGQTRFDILATTRSGQAVSTYILITPGS